jgi:hypothetical protein
MTLDQRGELMRLEGVWTGVERVLDAAKPYEASARLVFQTVFDGRFLLCDYSQTAVERPMSVGHGVFHRDDSTGKLIVTWFRIPSATLTQQAEGTADGDRLVFTETIDGRVTRTTYACTFDRLSIRTEQEVGADDWTIILDGSYRRR